MSLNESPLESGRRLITNSVRAHGSWRDVANTAQVALIAHVRELNPIVLYRIVALALAALVIGSRLHAHSNLREDAWIMFVALAHVVVTALAVPRLARASSLVNVLAIAVDILICVGLLTLSTGWRGPFWLYAISAVFWPSARFSLRGAITSVAVFETLVMAANFDLIRATVKDGFGGDLAARGLMVLIVAGATAMAAEALATVRSMAAEAERHRIARDLHDGVGKTMGGISLEARSLAQWIERDTVEAGRRARYVARISERAANEVRDVIRGLRETEATVPLFGSVRTLIADWEHATGMAVRLQLNGTDSEVPVLIHNEVLRMLNELLTNVTQHAAASEVRVRLTLSSAGVTLSVRDNGRGFVRDAIDPWSDDGHFGLLGTRERTSMLGGLCRIVSSPGKGTDVTVDLPLSPREERAVWLTSVLRPPERLR